MTNRSQIVITKVQDKTILVSVHNDKLYDVLVENEENTSGNVGDIFVGKIVSTGCFVLTAACLIPTTNPFSFSISLKHNPFPLSFLLLLLAFLIIVGNSLPLDPTLHLLHLIFQ